MTEIGHEIFQFYGLSLLYNQITSTYSYYTPVNYFLFNFTEGPLHYEEITSSSVTLSWKPPLDNGGSEVTGYAIEKRDLTHGGGWVPAVAYVNAKYNHSVVPKLIEGTQYEFRVMAENMQGRSDPLTTSKAIFARNQYIEPGQPSKPEILDSDKDHIKIKWNPPISNGGSSIIGYNVERRDMATGRWITISKNPVPNINYTDDRVTEGHQYQYRVSAVNAAGPGKASDPSNVLSAKPMKEKAKLHLDDLVGRKIKVRAGEPAIVKIELSGAPGKANTNVVIKKRLNAKQIFKSFLMG